MARISGFEREADLAVKMSTDATGAVMREGYLRTPVTDVLVVTTSTVGATFRQGFLRAANDALVVEDAVPSVTIHGLGRTASLALAVTTSSVGVGWVNGWRLSADRRVYASGLAAPPTDFQSLLMTFTPSLYWPLDSVNGATDQSGNGRNGTGAGGITIGGHASSPGILTNGSTDFDGTDDLISSTYLFALGSTRTYGGFAFRDTTGTQDQIVGASQGNGVNRRPALLSINTDATPAGITIDPDEGLAGTGTIADIWTESAWVFWTLIHNDSALTAELYLNGVSAGSVAGLNPMVSNNVSTGFQLGMVRNTNSPFDGKMAHVFVVESALTGPNIAALYDAAT